MEHLAFVVNYIARINTVIEGIVAHGGNWAYIVMFLILFTGAAFVFTAPVLPSVSLIFLVASLSVAGLLNPFACFVSLALAIVLGDLAGYYIGKLIGDNFISLDKLPIIKHEHILKTRKLYDGVDFITIVFARFTPMIGSFAQLVAGAVNYSLRLFFRRNILSGIIWLVFHFLIGWLVAIIPAVKNNYVILFFLVPVFSCVATAICFISKNTKVFAFQKK